MIIKDMEHKHYLKEREITLELERAREEIKLRELEIIKKSKDFERERKAIQESGI